MRILIQRVQKASIEINDSLHAQIAHGLVIFVGIQHSDTQKEADYLAHKCVELRLFSDENDKMNHSVSQVDGEILLVSQFTLYGSCMKGRRPEFTQSAPPSHAEPLYLYFLNKLKKLHSKVQAGVFGADMQVHLVNDGPVTLLVEK